jgi:hypothetical protein
MHEIFDEDIHMGCLCRDIVNIEVFAHHTISIRIEVN